jgi:hypothetical protein
MILGRIFFRPASRYGVAGVAASRFSLGRGRSVAATLGNHASRTIRRPESTVSTAGITGSDNTGHIEAGPNEAILFFDSAFCASGIDIKSFAIRTS